MDEFKIIQIIRRITSSYLPQPYNLSTDDDAAQIAEINHQAIISVDALEAGVHFPESASPFLIGYRAVVVAASDLAAMGVRPRGCFLALNLPAKHCHSKFIEGLASGFGLAASRIAMPLLGGNIIQGKSLGLSVTVVGDGAKCLVRKGAEDGDAIYVSGFLGDGAAGLKYATKQPQELNKHQAALRASYYCPSPRISLGQKLHGIAKSVIDISDGLLSDLQHILEQQQQKPKELGGAEIFLDKLPYSQAMLAVASAQERQDYALNGGDDYELLMIVDGGQLANLERIKTLYRLTHIGNITSGGEMIGIGAAGEKVSIQQQGYKHFVE